MACDRLVFRRYINFLLCLYIDLWTLKNFVIINSNTSFVLILFFFIDFFFFSVHSKNVILLSNLLLRTYRHMSSLLLLLYFDEFTVVFPLPLRYFAKEKKKEYTSFTWVQVRFITASHVSRYPIWCVM